MGYAWQGDMHAGGACVAGGHACVCIWQCGMRSGGHMHVRRGHAWQGVCMAGGACVAGERTTAADGTHPTGMHSCMSMHLNTLLTAKI